MSCCVLAQSVKRQLSPLDDLYTLCHEAIVLHYSTSQTIAAKAEISFITSFAQDLTFQVFVRFPTTLYKSLGLWFVRKLSYTHTTLDSTISLVYFFLSKDFILIASQQNI
jgi:hypothetical protein